MDNEAVINAVAELLQRKEGPVSLSDMLEDENIKNILGISVANVLLQSEMFSSRDGVLFVRSPLHPKIHYYRTEK
jgi:hypothetical protein